MLYGLQFNDQSDDYIYADNATLEEQRINKIAINSDFWTNRGQDVIDAYFSNNYVTGNDAPDDVLDCWMLFTRAIYQDGSVTYIMYLSEDDTAARALLHSLTFLN